MKSFIPQQFHRRMQSLHNDPIGIVRGVVSGQRHRLGRWYRETYGFRFSRPFYDLSRYFVNREARRLYHIQKAGMAPKGVHRQVIDDLRSKGLSILHFNDLFPDQDLKALQQSAESELLKSPNREIIAAAESGQKRQDRLGKFYLVRPLGDPPLLDLSDRWMQLSLSREMLEIACGYLEMLARLIYVQVWYNMPSPGPDVASQCWHRDPEDRRILKVFLYLRDVEEHHGPFCSRPETQNGGRFDGIYRQGINRYNYPPDGFLDRMIPGIAPQVCTGKAGTMIFCDTTGFHKGGHVERGGRLLFNAVYTTSAAVPVITQQRYYSITNVGQTKVGPEARFALGISREADLGDNGTIPFSKKWH